MFRLFVLVYFVIGSSSLYTQTCCSGGVPTASNLGLPATVGRSLQFSLAYDLNELNTQQTLGQKDGQPQSFRRTHSLMLQMGYHSNGRWGVDAFLPWISQQRRSNVNDIVDQTASLGDMVLLFKYQILSQPSKGRFFSLGIGPELPTGRTGFRADDGTILLADLQPGSGSWDGLLWAQFSTVLGFWPTASALLQTTYKLNSRNPQLGQGPASLTYQFGSEWQLIAGLNNRFAIAGRPIDIGLILRYRWADTDQSKPNSLPQRLAQMPNTGGRWLFASPSLSYWFSPSYSATLAVELPFTAKVGGTQVTPTYRVNASLFYYLPWAAPETGLPSSIPIHP